MRWSWDHPRVCGEKGGCFPANWGRSGSPPRVRGKEGLQIGGEFVRGITPACAGKSSIPSFLVMRFQGSPPRVRGKACSSSHRLRLHGITPACAGKSKKMNMRKDKHMGSPPRVRGKVACQGPRGARYRITPACAGKSPGWGSGICCDRDHPRVCGEKLKFIAAVFSMWGSPPRVRGKD